MYPASVICQLFANRLAPLGDPGVETGSRPANQVAEASTRRSYGRTLMTFKRWSDALTQLNEASALVPADAELHSLRGNCLKELGRWSEAETAYRGAMATPDVPGIAKYRNNLALLFSVWPDDTRIREGLELCDLIAREHPEFRWTAITRTALQQRVAARG